MRIGLDPFAFRQFDDPKYCGTRIDFPKETFITKVNEIIRQNDNTLLDGYAPFCKHIFVENFANALSNCIPITDETKKLIETGYIARRSEELPVLSRWVPYSSVKDFVRPAKFLDLILYSKEQISKENECLGTSEATLGSIDLDCPYSIIAIKAQDVSYELPMAPITVMRNAIISEGGSGVSIDRDAYMKSVEFWRLHIEIKYDS